MATLFTITAIREDAKARGSHWFDPDTMRFWRSRVLRGVMTTADGSSLFVSSEATPEGHRAYSVRRYREGRMDTLGDFMGYATAAQARAAMREYARR